MSGGVPELRFPGFEGEWEKIRLGTICEKVGSGSTPKGGSAVYKQKGIPLIRSQNVNNDRLDLTDVVYIDDQTDQKMSGSRVRKMDVLLNITGASIGRSCVVPAEFSIGNVNQHVCIIRLISKAAPQYIQAFLASFRGQKQVFQSQAGGGREGLNFENIRLMKLALPALPEQQKIAAFLDAVSGKISALSAERAGLVAYKRGVMQQLFSQSLRFTHPDGTPFPDWEERRLSSVLTEHKERNQDKLPIFSVSVAVGLVDQIEHLGRSFAAKETTHYNRVNTHDVVYTKSPTGDFPLGIIKQSKVGYPVAVSPLYGVFRPENPAIGYILHVLFESPIATKNYLHPLVQKGAKNTIAVTNNRFLEGKLFLPTDPQEQTLIANALSALDAKIDAVTTQISQMETFKKGLLQKMFV